MRYSLAGAAFYRYRGEARFVSAILAVFWMGVVSDLHLFPMFLAGRQPAPCTTTSRRRSRDRALGLEVPTVLDWIAQYPVADQFLA